MAYLPLMPQRLRRGHAAVPATLRPQCRRRSAGSATSRFASPVRPRRSSAPRSCAIASSTRRCRRSPMCGRSSRAATATRSTASAITCWCSITARLGRASLKSSAPTGCCARRSAERQRGFYSSGEFALERLVARHRDRAFLELGRSCVLKPYRTKRTVELLWHGIWSYVRQHGIDVMVGCASLEGTEPGPARAAPRLPASDRAGAGGLAGAGRARPRHPARSAEGEAGERGDGAPRPAATDQGVSPARRLCLRGRGDRLPVRHHRRVPGPAVERISTRYINYYGADASRHAA